MKSIKLNLWLLTACASMALVASLGDSTFDLSNLVVPRLLWFRPYQDRQPQQQQPIIIVPNQSNDNNRPPPYPYPYPPYPQRNPFFNGQDYGLGGGPSFVIINPNNMQGITIPGTNFSTISVNSTGRAFQSRYDFPIILNLLQRLAGSSIEEEEPKQVFQPDPIVEHDDANDDINEDELAILERQAANGVSPKHLLSLLTADRQRRRFQEAVAGVYLRNYKK